MKDAESLLAALDRQLARARLERDLPQYDRLTDETYLGIDAGGAVTTKAQRMAEFHDVAYDTFETDSHLVRIYGDIAIVTAQMVASGRLKGRDFGGTYRYTHVYRSRNGQWRIISSHACQIA